MKEYVTPSRNGRRNIDCLRMQETVHENGAQLVAERMLEKVRGCNIPHEKSDIASYVTISIGGTTDAINHLKHGSNYIKAADKA